MKKIALSTLLAFSLCSAVQAADPEDVVKYRQSIYQVMVWQFGTIKAMLAGEREWSGEELSQAASYLASATPMLDGAYAEGSITEDSDALEKIWVEWEQFDSLLNRLQEESADLAIIAESGDREAIMEQFDKTAAVCKECHDNYKD